MFDPPALCPQVDYNANFRLILQSKLCNPHYSPEIQAETTLINFTVSQEGLEEQILTLVVNKEKVELEIQKMEFIQQNNRSTIVSLVDLSLPPMSTSAFGVWS